MNGARYAYLNRICELVEQGNPIIIVSEDYAAPMFDSFRVKYPKHFLSVGIAEQNGVAVACGLALAGKYPIVYGCAPFPLTRAFDQVKSAVAMMHLPMTILNSGIGFGVPEFGATHYNVDDISIVRGIPGLRIVTPSDNIMATRLADFSIHSKETLYVRFDKNSEGTCYPPEAVNFRRGFYMVQKTGECASAVVVSCGFMFQEIMQIAEKLKPEGIGLKLIDLYSRPFDETAFLTELGDLPVLTIEEHVLQGGIGSAVLELLNKHQACNRIVRHGIDFGDCYPTISGSRNYFMKEYSLSPQHIEQIIREICS